MPQIIAKFVARITRRLRDWWINLGEYRQRQAAQSNTLEDFFTVVHNEFLGSTTHYTEVAREEFLLMKCSSFERKDLEKHFDRMSRRYYSFNGMDDVNAKHTFLIDWSCNSNCFFSFSFCPIRGKETDKSLTVEAIVSNFFSTTLIFFFKSSINVLEDEKV